MFNPLNPESNPICHLPALLGAHHILHVSRIRVNTNVIESEIANVWTHNINVFMYLFMSYLNKLSIYKIMCFLFIIQSYSVARGHKLLSIKYYVIEIMT